MKKILAILIVLVFTLSLFGCNNGGTTLSIEHDYSEEYSIKVDYSDKYKVNDERVNPTVKRPGIVAPPEVITIYQDETLLAYVRIYDITRHSSPNAYERRIEQIKRSSDPNAEKTPASDITKWEVIEDKTSSKNPYIIAKCTEKLKEDKPTKIGYDYLAVISEEEGFAIHLLSEQDVVDEKLLKDIIKNVKFSVVKK